MSLGVIGGSGLEAFEGLEGPRKVHAETPWGPPSSALVHARLDGHPVVFLSRHGESHAIAPHEINYRANLHALREAGVTGILAVATVGGLRADLGPGALVLPDQLIDYTSGRVSTFFQGPGVPVTHVDFTHPYDARLRALVQQAAIDLGETVSEGGTYGCTQGPRLETAAEIRRMRQDGCDLVGMTGMPEAVLARELGIPYAALAVVANHAAGIGGSAESISLEAIVQVVQAAMVRVRALIARTVTLASGA
jgi:5'-deoxy-5'-methylthioadenosine phosphorylase